MKLARYIILFAAILTAGGICKAETPAEFLGKCVAKLNAAKSIKADFSLTSSGKTIAGTLTSAGKKFTVGVTGATTWYNGKDIWSYSRANGEVTVWTPSAAELAETNPLLYLSTAKDYNVAFSPKSPSGCKTMVLTPKKRNTGIKQITVTANASTLLPTAISVKASGGNCDVKIKSIKLNVKINPSIFNFNKNNYPGVNVTDMR